MVQATIFICRILRVFLTVNKEWLFISTWMHFRCYNELLEFSFQFFSIIIAKYSILQVVPDKDEFLKQYNDLTASSTGY